MSERGWQSAQDWQSYANDLEARLQQAEAERDKYQKMAQDYAIIKAQEGERADDTAQERDQLRALVDRAADEFRWLVNPQQGVLHTVGDFNTWLADYDAAQQAEQV